MEDSLTTAHIVLAHPEPRSFNAGLKDVAVEAFEAMGWQVLLSDLYAMGFDPAESPRHYRDRDDPAIFLAQNEQRHASEAGSLSPEVETEIAKLEAADVVIFQFPMWWHSAPAILKGWFDRVFVYGRLYSSKTRYDRGHFRGRRAMLSVTTGAPEITFAHNGRSGDIDLLLWHIHYSIYYMGFEILAPFVAYGVESGISYSDPGAVRTRLEGYKESLRARLTDLDAVPRVPFSGWDDWDERGLLKPGVAGHSAFVRAEP